MFWTVPVPRRSLTRVNPGAGRARFRLSDFELFDQFDIPNALSDNPRQIAATCSFDIAWMGGGRRRRVRSRENDFAGVYRSGPATIEWSASNADGLSLQSAVQTQSRNAFVGLERNGRYYPGRDFEL